MSLSYISDSDSIFLPADDLYACYRDTDDVVDDTGNLSCRR